MVLRRHKGPRDVLGGPPAGVDQFRSLKRQASKLQRAALPVAAVRSATRRTAKEFVRSQIECQVVSSATNYCAHAAIAQKRSVHGIRAICSSSWNV